ncbi:hypothetical protein Tco_0644602, partial [Tanacetum coccineum]
IMEYLVKISKKARILELKRRNMKITVLTSNTPYPSRKIRRICACTSQKTTKEQDPIRRIQRRSIRRIQVMEIKYSGRYQTCNLVDNVLFEEVLVHQRLRKTLTHVLELLSSIYLCRLSMRFNLRRISLTGFLARCIESSNVDALDSPYLLVLIIETSQSRHHDKSESDSYHLSD